MEINSKELSITVQSILQSEFGSESFQFKDISRGGQAFIFEIGFSDQRHVLRICSRKQPIINNFEILKCLEGLDLSPVPIRSNQWNDLHYSIESFLPGQHESHSDQNVPKLFQSGTSIHQIHSDQCGRLDRLSHQSWSSYLHDKVRHHQPRFSQRASDPKKYIDSVLSICPEVDNFSLLHGDLWFGNSLLYQGKRYFIDFEKGIFGDKEFDFANTYYEQSLKPEVLDTIIEVTGYDKWKLLFYSVIHGIDYVSHGKEKDVESRVKRLDQVYGEFLNC